MKRILISVLTLALVNCEYVDNSLKIKNSRSYAITAQTFDKGRPEFNLPPYYLRADVIIKPQDEGGNFGLFCLHWPDVVERLPNKQLQIVIFRVDTVNKYKDSLTMYQLFNLKNYDALKTYSFDELEGQNWLLTY